MSDSEIVINLDAIRRQGIYLMTPAYGGQVFATYAQSVANLTALCTKHGIPFQRRFLNNESLITRARNYCISQFLDEKYDLVDYDGNVVEKKNFGIGIFIDSDIAFDAKDVLVMAHLQLTNENYNVICAPYPKKVIAYEKLARAVEMGIADEDPEVLAAYAGDYVFSTLTPLSRIDKPFEVFESGTGFMMFTRETIQKVIEANQDKMYYPDMPRTEEFNGSEMICAIFDTEIDPEHRRYLSEDYYFCKLVRKIGMEVWMVPYIRLIHNGYFAFTGDLAATLSIGQAHSVGDKAVQRFRKKANERKRDR